MRELITIPINILTDIKEPMTLRFLLWCVLQATREEVNPLVRGKRLSLLPGQFIFNRRKATVELEDYGFTERKIRTALSRCVASQYVSQYVSQKITTITVNNFSTYMSTQEESVPESVPKSVPKKACKTRQTKKTPLIRNTRNTGNTSNKDKYPELGEYISRVLKHYRSIFPTFGRTVRPGHKDWNLIGARIKDGYSVDECCSAVNGNSVDAWYKAKGLHSLRYIFRDADLMDRFIQTWENHHQPIISDKAKRGAQAAQAWANLKEETHG
jgi:hypothetical protein